MPSIVMPDNWIQFRYELKSVRIFAEQNSSSHDVLEIPEKGFKLTCGCIQTREKQNKNTPQITLHVKESNPNSVYLCEMCIEIDLDFTVISETI